MALKNAQLQSLFKQILLWEKNEKPAKNDNIWLVVFL